MQEYLFSQRRGRKFLGDSAAIPFYSIMTPIIKYGNPTESAAVMLVEINEIRIEKAKNQKDRPSKFIEDLLWYEDTRMVVKKAIIKLLENRQYMFPTRMLTSEEIDEIRFMRMCGFLEPQIGRIMNLPRDRVDEILDL